MRDNTARSAAIKESARRFLERRAAQRTTIAAPASQTNARNIDTTEAAVRIFEYRIANSAPWLTLLSTNTADTPDTLRSELAVRFGHPVEVRERIHASQGGGR